MDDGNSENYGTLLPQKTVPYARYTVAPVADGAGAQAYNEITSFTYNNEKYTATWNMSGTNAGWTVTKN